MKTFLNRFRANPALLISCMALFVALGGASYAAITLPRNSVGTNQLKQNAVISSKVLSLSMIDHKCTNVFEVASGHLMLKWFTL